MDKVKKLFSPGAEKDDSVLYGTPSTEPTSTADTTQTSQSSTLETKPEAEQKDTGVLRQIFNPGGDKYSEQSYGTTATANPTMSDQLQKEPASSEPMRGPETAQYNNDKVQQGSLDSTPAGTTSTGPSTMAREDNQDDVSNATFTARSYALGSGHSADPQQTSSYVDQATRATTDLGPTGDEPSREHAGRRLDHSLSGAATGGAGAGYVNPDELNEFMRHGRDPEADQATYLARDHYVGSSADANPFQRPGHELYNPDKGPAGVESAGEVAPGHIPGEFPADDGGDVHNSSSGLGSGSAAAAGIGAGAGAGAAGIAANLAYNDRSTADSSRPTGGSSFASDQSSSPIQTTTNTVRSGSFSRPGQESTSDPKSEPKENSSGFKGALAAATAAMGLGGAGAYAASRDDKDDARSKPAVTTPSSQTPRNTGSSAAAPGSVVSEKTQSYTQHRPGQESSTSRAVPQTVSSSQRPADDDHTTRNSARTGAGAAGATGAGAYALSQGRDRDEPQSIVSDDTQRYGGSRPTDSSTTTSATRSAAPIDESRPRQTEQDDHTKRDTALVGGAGGLAAAGGASALGRNERDTLSVNNTGNAQSVVSPETQKYHRGHPGDDNTDLASSGTSSSTNQPIVSSQPVPSSQPISSSQNQPTNQTGRPEDDHTGRNAAAAAAATGLGGAGAAYAFGRGDNSDSNAQSVVSPETQRYAGTHPSDTVTSQQSSGSTSTLPSRTQPTSQSQQPRSDDHTVASFGTAAGVGAGASTLGNRDREGAGNAQSVVSPETQRYAGSHPSDLTSSYQPSNTTNERSSQSQPASSYQQPREDHSARNAGLAAGGLAGGGAAAGYALGRENDNAGGPQSVVSPETQRYHGSHPETTAPTQPTASSKSAEPASYRQPTETPGYGSSARQPQDEDHTGRNLTGAGLGAAGVGAGAYALGRDSENTRDPQSVVSPQTQQYHGSNPETTQTTTTTTTTTSRAAEPAHSSRKPDPVSSSRPTEPASYSSRPAETTTYDRSAERPKEEDHTTRNLAGAGLGAAGLGGAYAMTRDDDKSRTVPQPAETQRYPSGTSSTYSRPVDRQDDYTTESTVLGAGPATGGRSTTQPQEDDHRGRDTALTAGGASATGAGAGYALSQGRGDTGPASKTLGPHESNVANVADPRVRPEPTQQFEKTTAGPYQSNIANKMDPRVTSDPAKAQQQEAEQGHNYSRDAAIAGGAAGAGAAGYGAYQYANRDQPPQQATQQYPPQQQQQYAPPPQEKYKEPKAEKVKETKPEKVKESKPEKVKETHHEPKHEKESRHEKEHRPEDEHDPRVIAGSDGHNKLHKKAVDPEEDHTGRNAAIGAGAVGTAGVAGYGASQYYDDKSDAQATGEGQEGEKKHGLLHKILHPREHKREKEEEERRRSSDNRRSYEAPSSSSAAAPPPAVATGPSGTDPRATSSTQAGDGNVVTEPHTGLPMNVGKYGSGQGGTDGNTTIEGYHETAGQTPGNTGSIARQY